jgi:hypothetical protein
MSPRPLSVDFSSPANGSSGQSRRQVSRGDLASKFASQFLGDRAPRMNRLPFESNVDAISIWRKLLEDQHFRLLQRDVFLQRLAAATSLPSPSSSSSSTLSSSNLALMAKPASPSRISETPHQNLLFRALSVIASLLPAREVFVRDTHSEKAPRTPTHKMDACLVWSDSTSAEVNLHVKWPDVICPVEIKPEINDECVMQLCDTASEIFVQQSGRELVYGVGMSSLEVQLFRFSCPIDGEPHLSWSHTLPLFRSELDLQAPTPGFLLLVELVAQQVGALGFLPRGVDSEFLRFLKQNSHVRNHFDVALLQSTARKSFKPELLSLKLKHVASLSSSSSASSSALPSPVDWADVKQMVCENPVELDSLVLDSVCIAVYLFHVKHIEAVGCVHLIINFFYFSKDRHCMFQDCVLKIFSSRTEFERELQVYQRIRELSADKQVHLSRLVCQLELTRSKQRTAPAVPAHAGALVVWPIADFTLADLHYNHQNAFCVADTMLRALVALHELRVCHADMSSSNVLIQNTEPIKVWIKQL